jgi:hypothetical protein
VANESSGSPGIRQAIIADIRRLTLFLAPSSDLKAANEDFRSLVGQWRECRERVNSQDWPALRSRFDQTCVEFKLRRDGIIQQRDVERSENARSKRQLTKEAERFAWEKTTRDNAEKLKQLQQVWKEIGSAGRDEDEALWRRFRQAADDFFSRRNHEIEQYKEEQRRNLFKKRDLVREARSALSGDDWRQAKEQIKALQRQWKSIGSVPRDDADEIWNEFRDACDAVFEGAHRYHIASTYEQIDKTKANIGKLNEMIAHLEEVQDRKREQLSRIGGSGDWVHGRTHELEISIGDLGDKILERRRWLDEAYSRLRLLESRL